jgi:hypothetical protein
MRLHQFSGYWGMFNQGLAPIELLVGVGLQRDGLWTILTPILAPAAKIATAVTSSNYSAIESGSIVGFFQVPPGKKYYLSSLVSLC